MFPNLWTLVDLVFPRFCLHCHVKITPDKYSIICMSCELRLGEATDTGLANPMLVSKFKGIFPYHGLISQFYFVKDGVLQSLVHLAKYKSRPDILHHYGRLMGNWMNHHQDFQNELPDYIVTVPNHWLKKRKLGYNQAWEYANTISKFTKIPMAKKALVRTKNTNSQTSKNKENRLHLLKEVYKVRRGKKLIGKHVLLIDDIITSGATIEVCADLLLKQGVSKLSVLCLGVVKH